MAEELVLEDGGGSLVVRACGVAVATYVHDVDAPAAEAPKPYWHPLRTLRGAPLTAYRPWDHRWHKGLQMTWTDVSGQNFWGGPTFVRGAPGTGYVWQDNVGSIRHEAFGPVVDRGPQVRVEERLAWWSSTGDRWLEETRVQRCSGVDRERGLWVLDFSTRLRNVRGCDLVLGSPTTLGRSGAGYTGLLWRGPRSFADGELLGCAGGADAAMGARADWLAVAGQHDELDGGATVLAFAGSSSADVPIRWFVRLQPYPALNPSPAFDQEVVLGDGEALELRHRFAFVDEALDARSAAALASELQP